MKLYEFISDTLAEIAIGVHKAQIEVKDIVAIAPGHLYGTQYEEKTNVEFDIAVTVTENDRTGDNIQGTVNPTLEVFSAKISAGSATLESSSTLEYEQNHEHRVRFSVPIILSANFRNDSNYDQVTGSVVKDLIQNRKEQTEKIDE